MLEPAIKWSGSKRSQAQQIIQLFPLNIKTYYEPFVGGGSVLYTLLNSNIHVTNIICSDINNDLIELWNDIKTNPDLLVHNYELMWNELNKDDDIQRKKEYYNYIRSRFNEKRDTSDFLFINRTTTNGLIRYNSKNEFNSSFHFSRKGIEPKRLKRILLEWSALLNKHNVIFICQDYKKIILQKNDFMYLDPPYFSTKNSMYMRNTINFDEFFSFLRNSPSGYILSFDGTQGNKDNTYNVPNDIYNKHIYLKSGNSSFKLLKEQIKSIVYESLYIKNP